VFDKLKAMGALAGLLKDKEKLREAAERVKARAAEVRGYGSAGAGAVRATVDGRMKVLSIELEPALAGGMAADDRTRELAGSLIAEAVNDAMARAQARMREVIEKEAADLGLPGLPPDLGGLLA
jgi:DNA-binding protein YbaB